MNSVIKIATLLSVLIIACSIFFSCGKESNNDWDSGDSTEVSETMEKSDGESLETPESSDKSDENSETSETTNGDAENGSSSEEAVSVITDGGKYDFNK